MYSARTLLATAAATAAIVLSAPAAYAVEPDRDHEDSSYSKEHDGGRDYGHDSEDSWNGKKHEKHEKEDSGSGKHDESWKRDHDKPKGGMRTGGGALDAPTVNAGGLAILAVAGAGLYAARRRKTATSAA